MFSIRLIKYWPAQFFKRFFLLLFIFLLYYQINNLEFLLFFLKVLPAHGMVRDTNLVLALNWDYIYILDKSENIQELLIRSFNECLLTLS
jgi:hypothetical protein